MEIPFKDTDGQRITERIESFSFLPDREGQGRYRVAYVRAFDLRGEGRCGYGVLNCAPDAPFTYSERFDGKPELYRTTNLMGARDIARHYAKLRQQCDGSATPVIALSEAQWFFDDIQSDLWAGLNRWREISESDYTYALEVLPPMDWRGSAFMISEALTGDVHAGLVQIGDRYFGREISRAKFHAEADRLRAHLSQALEQAA